MLKTSLASSRIFVGLALTAAVLCAGITPAYATESVDDSISSLIESVAPDQGEVAATESVFIHETGTSVSMSADAAVATEITDSDSNTLFSVPLPTGTLDPVGTAPDGTAVYDHSDSNVNVAVQIMEDGVTRVQTVLGDENSPSAYSYEIPEGFEPVIGDEGEIALLGEEGYVLIGDAWARDAEGKDVPTSYSVQDGSIVQTVEATADTVFPVVADPTWMWYSGAYGMRFSKAETRNLVSKGSVTGFCATLGLYKAPVAGALCGIYGAYFFTQANAAKSNNRCFFVAAAPAPVAFQYLGSGCN